MNFTQCTRFYPMCHAYYDGPAFGVSGFRLEMGFINLVTNHEFFDMGFSVY